MKRRYVYPPSNWGRWTATAVGTVSQPSKRRYVQPTGQQLKLNGMTVAAAAVPSWSKLAAHTIDHVLGPQAKASGITFVSEDLTDLIGLPRGKIGTNTNNAVGSAFGAASGRGTIRWVGTYRKSRRSSSHAADIKEWIGT